MANTYTLISAVTVGAGGSATISFSSIPQTYTDLKLVLSGRSDSASLTNVQMQPNGSTSSLSGKQIYGDGASAFSGTDGGYGSKAALPGTSQTASTFNNVEWYIPNYTGSTNKSFSCDSVQETNATTAYAQLWAGLWSDTSAITSITLDIIEAGNFVTNSTAYLYGIKNS
jgi:hypothetical protein